jgi:cystathionine beta-lyase
MNFDSPIDRRGTHSNKWDDMEMLFGVSPQDGLAMWTADMDFRAPAVIQDALAQMHKEGIYGYFGDHADYHASICWWMKERHGWSVDPQSIFTTNGLLNGVAVCIDAFTSPGDGIVMFTPIYHSFFRAIRAADRVVVECEMPLVDGRYELDFESYEAQMTGAEKMLILCSPHNPSGRIWTKPELRAIAAFAKRHDLLIVSDEIHHDLLMPGQVHTPMSLIDGIEDRLIMATSASKTFNLAGTENGNIIIQDKYLRDIFAKRKMALNISTTAFGPRLVTAAYSPEGAEWLDGLRQYIDGNRKLFDQGITAIPGVRSVPIAATYMAWIDFSRTGLTPDEVKSRVQKDARIAPSPGHAFGKGGESFLRFNLGTQRANVAEAIDRLQRAFADLQ